MLPAVEKALELDPTIADAYRLRSSVRFNDRDTAGALSDLNRALELDARNVEALLGRGYIKGESGDYAGAMADLRKALEIDPGNAQARVNEFRKEWSDRLIAEAEALLNDRKYDEAEARVNKALEIDSESEPFHEALRIIAEQRRKAGQ
jgi:tetratricopeptide (TPR) repeat protein